MPTQTYIDNSRGKVVNIIPKRTMHHAHNPNALKTEEEKKSNPLKIHQNTLVSHPAPKLLSASNFFDVLRSMN
jgi:predicted rRNA methylase YqxC with S4 and FtsJ domains